MSNETIYLVSTIVALFLLLKPFKTKYHLERFKPLLVIPLVILPFVLKGIISEKSWLTIVLSSMLTVYALWKTFRNLLKDDIHY